MAFERGLDFFPDGLGRGKRMVAVPDGIKQYVVAAVFFAETPIKIRSPVRLLTSIILIIN